MASTTKAKSAKAPKPGDPVRFEGELYEFSGPEPGAAKHTTASGWVAFHRPVKLGKGDTRYKRVRCELKDLEWSEAHGAFILPGRGVWVHHPKTPPLVRRYFEGGLEPADDPKEAADIVTKAAKAGKPYRRPLFIEDALPSDYADLQVRRFTGEG